MQTLSAFNAEEVRKAKLWLATQVALMMGRKLEEGDWTKVYCQAKSIPLTGWSNLHIDVNHCGLGLEIKLLRISDLNELSLKSVCGTTLMHPALTRSIRIEDVSRQANEVMEEVFSQYADLVNQRTQRVRQTFPGVEPDMRIGWLIWEDRLAEFLYFEEPMRAPQPKNYFAEWNETPARGIRKSSKSLWIYERKTKQKRYSVTTSAGIKIQPYFDVPPPSDPNLYYFRVQSEPIDADTVLLWVSSSTANALKQRLGSLEQHVVSEAICRVLQDGCKPSTVSKPEEDVAVSIPINVEAYNRIRDAWEAVSDEHRAQLLLKALA